MLNFLCAAAEEDLQAVLRVIVVFVALVIFILSMVKKGQRGGSTPPATNNGDDPFTHPNDNGKLTPEQQRYILNTKAKSINKTTTPTVAQVQADHAHSGEEENYDPIVGSLGAVYDEGCTELDGVRLIATDLMYQTDDEHVAYDMDAIRKSLILGEILNNPRFKKPHGRK